LTIVNTLPVGQGRRNTKKIANTLSGEGKGERKEGRKVKDQAILRRRRGVEKKRSISAAFAPLHAANQTTGPLKPRPHLKRGKEGKGAASPALAYIGGRGDSRDCRSEDTHRPTSRPREKKKEGEHRRNRSTASGCRKGEGGKRSIRPLRLVSPTAKGEQGIQNVRHPLRLKRKKKKGSAALDKKGGKEKRKGKRGPLRRSRSDKEEGRGPAFPSSVV